MVLKNQPSAHRHNKTARQHIGYKSFRSSKSLKSFSRSVLQSLSLIAVDCPIQKKPQSTLQSFKVSELVKKSCFFIKNALLTSKKHPKRVICLSKARFHYAIVTSCPILTPWVTWVTCCNMRLQHAVATCAHMRTYCPESQLITDSPRLRDHSVVSWWVAFLPRKSFAGNASESIPRNRKGGGTKNPLNV